MAIETTTPRSRRALLAAGLGAIGATVASALGRPAGVRAADGEPVLLGTANTASAPTTITSLETTFAVVSTAGEGIVADAVSTALRANSQSPTRGTIEARSLVRTAVYAIGGDEGLITPPAKTGVFGYANQDANAIGVQGKSVFGTGVLGISESGRAVRGVSVTGTAVQGLSTTGTGVSSSSGSGKAHYASNGSATNPAILAQNTAGSSAIEGYSGGGAPPPAEAKTGIHGVANQDTTSNGVLGRSTHGTGLWGDTTDGVGVVGTGSVDASIGVVGSGGLGVYAAGGIGLVVDGPSIFSTSGKQTIASGSLTTVSVPGGLGSDSIALAVLQTNKAGVWVRAVTQNVAGGTITIYLNTSVSSSTTIGWFVIN